MIKLTSKLAEENWSDYILWWPEKQVWLSKPKQTLYAYGVQADARLEFVCQHRHVVVELPDRKQYSVRINFAVPVFQVVMDLCREFKIRHPEELSLMRSPQDKEGFVKLTGFKKIAKRTRSGTPMSHSSSVDSAELLEGASTDSPRMKKKLPNLVTAGADADELHSFAAASFIGEATDGGFFSEKLCRTVQERTYLNGLWLDSARSLYEQEVATNSHMYLRFKYYSIMDLDMRVDEVRITQLYEQAKWAVLTEDVDCTEEEAYAFAALQFQVKLASQLPQNKAKKDAAAKPVTDIDEALSKLQMDLGQEKETHEDEGPTLQLKGPIKYSKPSRLTLKTAKKHFFLLKGTTLTCYKDEAAFSADQFIEKFNLSGAEVSPDVDVSKNRFIINISVATGSKEENVRLILEDSDDFCKWMAGARMVAKGKSLSRQGYEVELTSVKSVIALQHKSGGSQAASQEELHPEDVVPPRLLKKHKPKQIVRNILEAHSSMLNLTLMEARMKYIRNWMALQDFGVALFLVRFHRAKKDDVVGIAYNRLVLVDPQTLEHRKTWRYSAMRSWNVNWEARQIRVDHEDGTLLFHTISADLKIVHEFIGGNIFLSLRKEKEPLDIEMFFKLTGGVQSHASGFAAEISARSIV